MKAKVDIFGGSLIKRLVSNHDFCENYDIGSSCLWVHPLTFDKADNKANVSLECFCDFLKSSKSEILVLELSSLRFSLVETEDGTLVRKEDAQRDFPKTNRQYILTDFENEFIEQKLSIFCKNILDYSNYKKIILISATQCKFTDNGKFIVPAWEDSLKISEKIEQAEIFVEKYLQCYYYDLTKYFYNPGQSFTYEYNESIYNIFSDFIQNAVKNKRRDLFQKADLPSKLRYALMAEGFNSLQYKSVTQFYCENKFDTLLTYTSTAFITENLSYLARLRENINNFGDENLYNSIKLLKKPNVRNVLITIIDFLAEQSVEDLNISNLTYDMVITDLICKAVGEQISKRCTGFNKRNVVWYNLKYYITLLQNNEVKPECLYQPKRYPILIDIFGSCISRFVINYVDLTQHKSKIVVNNYIYHANPLNINYVPENRYEDTADSGKTYFDRNLEVQLNGELKKVYENSDSEWLIVDLYALFGNNIYTNKGRDFLIGHNIANKYKFIKSKPIYQKCDLLFVWEKLKEFADFIKAKYESNIILLSAKNTQYFVREGIIKEDNKSVKDINDFLDEIENRFVNYLGCGYYIDIGKYFISTTEQLSGVEPFHFEPELYFEEFKLIYYILNCKPDKHYYGDISDSLLLNRFLKYRNKNENSILKLYPYNTEHIWKFLLKANTDYIDKNRENILSVIKKVRYCRNIGECCNTINFSQDETRIINELLER